MLVFIHVPKTGGMSAREFIKTHPFTPVHQGKCHDSARHHRERLGAEIYDKATTFAVVRNPFTRFVSACREGGLDHNDPLVREMLHGVFGGDCAAHPVRLWQGAGFQAILLQTQFDMVTIDGEIAVDKIFHYEEDVPENVRAWLVEQGCDDVPFPHNNKKGGKCAYIGEPLSPEARAFVKDFYSEDFALFGYSMEP